MRKIFITSYVSLDGVMQAPGGPEEDPSGGFGLGGWSFTFWDDIMGAEMDEQLSAPADLLLGRRTYEIFAAHWPYQPAEDLAAASLNAAKKYVVSNTLTTLDWQNCHRVSGDVVGAIRALKAENGPDLSVIGSAGLIRTLLANGLVDEFRVWTFPVVLGKGKRLFEEGAPPGALRLERTVVSTTGVVISVYRPAGDVPIGTFAPDSPSARELERRKKVAGEESHP